MLVDYDVWRWRKENYNLNKRDVISPITVSPGVAVCCCVGTYLHHYTTMCIIVEPQAIPPILRTYPFPTLPHQFNITWFMWKECGTIMHKSNLKPWTKPKTCIWIDHKLCDNVYIFKMIKKRTSFVNGSKEEIKAIQVIYFGIWH